MMGGVHIPFKKGEKAHSDGDVLLHAITDALLGACGMGDIGEFFPPSDKKWKDASTRRTATAYYSLASPLVRCSTSKKNGRGRYVVTKI